MFVTPGACGISAPGGFKVPVWQSICGKCGGRSDPAAGGESRQPLENREGFNVPLPSPVHLQLLLHEEALICGIFTCPA